MLSQQQGQVLVRLARQEIERHLGMTPSRPVTTEELRDPALQERRGVFVTLHKRGDLRGCIGSLAAAESIVDGTRRNALNAAFHDYRFEPLTTAELPALHVEVSVLTEPQPLAYENADDLLRLLRPGVDGVILQGPGGASATFLPQVWQQLPAPDQFLGHLCRKAGLAQGAWRSGTLGVFTYQVQSFEEPRADG
ncbi:AMMECR1 domain protein [Desulfobulbus propionicus DSM 2032]|jgi:AmmeMemoRadiSam system protein A|uniref:AMMECR1 domain protein n=1 Tax=Desulfobulbus propionicus (strain ATCC 33891 / DSM 2032 / VKM B-1956 / 1pr3) TaxID=577650 RepID=A0A7U3YJC0_DESPD|nr:AmmeMemoRadiSam system protein A [Desulfobulbus propionicus]ADW16460.1 AMMECR1 domain protein [Desulfobulbus propionicus DSM 2032]